MGAGLDTDGNLREVNLRAKCRAVMIGVTLRGLAHHHVESKAAARNLTVGAQTRRVGGVKRVHAQATAAVRIKVVAIVEAWAVM